MNTHHHHHTDTPSVEIPAFVWLVTVSVIVLLVVIVLWYQIDTKQTQQEAQILEQANIDLGISSGQ